MKTVENVLPGHVSVAAVVELRRKLFEQLRAAGSQDILSNDGLGLSLGGPGQSRSHFPSDVLDGGAAQGEALGARLLPGGG